MVTPAERTDLRSSFDACWGRWIAEEREFFSNARPKAEDARLMAVGATVFDDLVRRYGEPPRAYHTLDHIAAGLAELDAISSYVPRLPRGLFELAWWFHDAVYDPLATDNERRSEQLLRETLAPVGPAVVQTNPEWEDVEPQAALLAAAAALILATTHDQGATITPERRCVGTLGLNCARMTEGALPFFLDVDLAILGQDVPVYDAYEAGIRSEYAFAPGALYVDRRTSFLEGLVSRGIYHTTLFRWKYEERARANIARAVARLRADGADAFLA